MAIPKNDKHSEYSRYAEHSLEMVRIATDRKSRIIQREMAAEWPSWRMLFPVNHKNKRVA
jgi:hypothetical protein